MVADVSKRKKLNGENYRDKATNGRRSSAEDKKLVMLCVPDSYGKCVECGGTMRTEHDWQMHRCQLRKKTEQIYDREIRLSELRVL